MRDNNCGVLSASLARARVDENAATIMFCRARQAHIIEFVENHSAVADINHGGKSQLARQNVALVWTQSTRPRSHKLGMRCNTRREKKHRETASDIYLSAFLRLSYPASGLRASALVKFAPCTHTRARTDSVYECTVVRYFSRSRLFAFTLILSRNIVGFRRAMPRVSRFIASEYFQRTD